MQSRRRVFYRECNAMQCSCTDVSLTRRGSPENDNGTLLAVLTGAANWGLRPVRLGEVRFGILSPAYHSRKGWSFRMGKFQSSLPFMLLFHSCLRLPRSGNEQFLY